MASLFDSLRRVQLQERQSSAITSVSEGFFDECRAFLKQTREQGERGDSFAMREAGNFEEVFKNVVDARAQKILFKTFRDLKAGTVNTEGLAREEKEFYNSLTKLFTEFEASALNLAFQPTSVQTPAENCDAAKKFETHSSALKNVKARFLLDMPRFPWKDSAQYGPFKKGEVAELHAELAEFLNQRKAIEFVSN